MEVDWLNWERRVLKWMNKWMKEWMNKWMNKWMNEWMNEWAMNESKNDKVECRSLYWVVNLLTNKQSTYKQIKLRNGNLLSLWQPGA